MKKPILEEMTLREKIGQTVVFRHMLYCDIKPEDFAQYFKDNVVGFTWPMSHPKESYKTSETLLGNPELTGRKDDMYINLINLMNENMSIPVMPSVDAANGIVPSKFEDHGGLPTATGLGAANSKELAYRYGKGIAEDLHSIGFRWLWSPTADNAGKFTDSRHLSSNRDRNCELLTAFIDGVHSAGVATCTKHFPGEDPYEYRDSHFCSAAYTLSLDEWKNGNGKEFMACIKAGTDGIMISHRCFPAIDNTRVNGAMLPCTLSYKVITEFIKGELGYEGVILTDDCDMKGLTAIYQEEKLYVELLRAGNDVVLGPTRLDYVDIVEKAVLAGDLPESRIDDACRRVLALKEKYGIFDHGTIPHPTEERRAEIKENLHKVAEEIASRGLSLAANRTNFVPVKKDSIKRAIVFYIGYSDMCFDNLKYIADEFARYGVECDIKRGYQKSDEEVLDGYDLIIYATYIGFHAPLGGHHFYGAECRMLWDVMTKGIEKSVAVSFGDTNIFYNYFTACPTFVNCYSTNRETMEGFVRGLFGDVKFTDFHPFPLNPVNGTNDVYGVM